MIAIYSRGRLDLSQDRPVRQVRAAKTVSTAHLDLLDQQVSLTQL